MQAALVAASEAACGVEPARLGVLLARCSTERLEPERGAGAFTAGQDGSASRSAPKQSIAVNSTATALTSSEVRSA